MTRTAIEQAALKRFAEQGYDGTSMTDIAGDVGVKAPAIYAHFKGKTELFLHVLDGVIEQELEYTREFLSRPGKAEDVLSAYLRDIGYRFEASPHLRFMLNAAYLPPYTIADQLDARVKAYMNGMETIINDAFRFLPPSRLPPEQLAVAYMGIMDSIQAEVLYGGQHSFLRRLNALWELFRLALQ